MWRLCPLEDAVPVFPDAPPPVGTPADRNQHPTDIETMYRVAIRNAKRSIVIVNAYFFPGWRFVRDLRRAAERGVDVLLVMQGKPDRPISVGAASLLYNDLLSMGIRIVRYTERPLHAKVAVIDDRWSTVGSSNLDPLSLSLNLEANVIIDDEEFNRMLSDHLLKLIRDHGEPISMQVVRRSYWWRMPLIFLSFHFLRHYPVIAGWFPAHAPKLELISAQKRLWKKDHYDQERA